MVISAFSFILNENAQFNTGIIYIWNKGLKMLDKKRTLKNPKVLLAYQISMLLKPFVSI